MRKNYISLLNERDLQNLKLKFIQTFQGELLGVDIKKSSKKDTLILTLYLDDAKVEFLLTEFECKIRKAHEKLIQPNRHLDVYQTWFDFMKSKSPDYINELNDDVLARYDR